MHYALMTPINVSKVKDVGEGGRRTPRDHDASVIWVIVRVSRDER